MDVELTHTPDGGEMRLEDGQVVLTTDPWTSAYISLFGGNVEDDGTTATKRAEWWGNKTEPDETRHIRSRTQAVLMNLPAIPANIRLLEEAAENDLEWMKATGLAREIEATGRIPAVNSAEITIDIVFANGERESRTFERPWSKA